MGGKHAPWKGATDVPVELPPYVRQSLGAESGQLLEALKAPSPVSIRLNPGKQAACAGEPVPWCTEGRYLADRPVFTLDPMFHQGAYYVQEAASMLVEQAYRACTALPEYAVALDLCAAPGGKSTHLAALLPPNALLICNEPERSRQRALLENLWKWGRPGAVVTGSLPAAFRPMGTFCDLVLVDAPCSGEGMFRKDPFARGQWSEALVDSCAIRQRGILDEAWAVLKPGGYLIYSTCTWEARENEEQVQRLADRGAQLIPVPTAQEWGVLSTGAGLRCYPHRVRGEGFFMALLRKPMGDIDAGGRQYREVLPPQSPQEQEVLNWMDHPEDWALFEQNEVLHALPKPWTELTTELARHVKVLAPGTPVAVEKGSKWTPHPALALSTMLRRGAFPVITLDHAGALRYLRGEALPATDAKGVVLLLHNALGVGWAHGAGARWNNNWPAPWRIRMR